jgi:uncharacterized membrane protein
MTWFRFWLLLHIFVAIAAFGPTYAFGFIAGYARKDPKNAHLVMEIIHGIETRITIPAAVVMPFLGLALIYSGHFPLWKNTWLVIAIILYTILFFFSVIVQRTNTLKMIQAIERTPAPAPGTGEGPPPPETAALGRTIAMGGVFQTLLLTAIIVLMIWRPGCIGICGS